MNGVRVFKSSEFLDERGSFLKLYTHEQSGYVEPFVLFESFISESRKGVVRGFHLQTGISANHRVIQVIEGKVLDVLLDLRTDSNTFGMYESMELSADNRLTLLIPPGVAHGFQALEKSKMLYMTSSAWDPARDTGVRPVGSGFTWPLPITFMSQRDTNLPTLEEFNSGIVH